MGGALFFACQRVKTVVFGGKAFYNIKMKKYTALVHPAEEKEVLLHEDH